MTCVQIFIVYIYIYINVCMYVYHTWYTHKCMYVWTTHLNLVHPLRSHHHLGPHGRQPQSDCPERIYIFVDIHMYEYIHVILYMYDKLLHVYIYTYIHTYIYIYIYIYYEYLHTGHMVTFQMLRLYILILTITIKDTFWWENKMILNIKIQGEGSSS